MRNNRLKRLRKRTMREIQEDRKRFDKMYHPTLEPKRNLLKRAGLNPHVHTKIQLKKMTKTGLIRLVIKLEKFIVSHAYEMYKAKLPRLRKSNSSWSKKDDKRISRIYEQLRKTNTPKRIVEYPDSRPGTQYDKQGRMVSFGTPRIIDLSPKALQRHGYDKKTTKRKRKKLTGAAKAKFLARMNKGRRRKGLKPIRSR